MADETGIVARRRAYRISLMSDDLEIRPADPTDLALVLSFIREIAEFEDLSHEVIATEEGMSEYLFGERPVAEVLIAEIGGRPVGFALFYQNFSTFVGRPGIHLEDMLTLSTPSVDPSHETAGEDNDIIQALQNPLLTFERLTNISEAVEVNFWSRT